MERGETGNHRERGRLRPWIGDPPLTSPPDVEGYRLRSHQRFDMMHGSIAGMSAIPFWWVFVGVVSERWAVATSARSRSHHPASCRAPERLSSSWWSMPPGRSGTRGCRGAVSFSRETRCSSTSPTYSRCWRPTPRRARRAVTAVNDQTGAGAVDDGSRFDIVGATCAGGQAGPRGGEPSAAAGS